MTPVLHRHTLSRPTVGLVYRALVLGLLGAIACLAALAVDGQRAHELVIVREPDPPRYPGDVIIDVSRRAAGDHVVDLLGLAPGERVIAIDDRPAITEDVIAVWRSSLPRGYLDLTIAPTNRRVLVLVHP